MPILEVQNIEKHFGETKVLENISFTMDEGTALTIIGSSGSGKTTLLRCLNFLETPDGGSFSVNGQVLFDAAQKKNFSEEEIRRRRLHFGLVFQQFNLFPQYTALENVMLAPQLSLKTKAKTEHLDVKQESEKIRENAKELLDRMGLSNRMDNYPHQLSGGQQQRVSIGRALMNAPAVMLADEPTGNLDSKNSREIIELLKMSNEKYDQTLIVITHDENIALQADRIIAVEDGRITRDEVIRR